MGGGGGGPAGGCCGVWAFCARRGIEAPPIKPNGARTAPVIAKERRSLLITFYSRPIAC